MYYLCEKYYKPIAVQYYIIDCISWTKLALLDLQTNYSCAALEGGNSRKKEIQSVSQKMNSKAVLQIYSTLSPLHTNEFHSESVCTTVICL